MPLRPNCTMDIAERAALTQVGCLLLGFISRSTYASPIVPGLQNHACYAQEGDLYVGALLRVMRASTDDRSSFCSNTLRDAYRMQYVEAVKLAIDQINNSSQILPNISLGFVVTDTCGLDLAALAQSTYFLPSDGAYSRRKLTPHCENGPPEVPIAGVVGPATSREAVLAASVLSTFQIPIIGTTATSDELSDKIRYKYFLRMVPPDKFQVEAMLDLMLHFNWTYVSLLYAQGSYGSGAAREVTYGARMRGMCLPVTEAIEADIDADRMDYHLNKLVHHREARVVIIFLSGHQQRVLFERIATKKLEGWFIWVSGDSMAGKDHGPASDGAFLMYHIVAPVPEFTAHVVSLTPANNAKNPWMRQHWELLYGCKWSSSSNNASDNGNNEIHNNSSTSYTDEISCESMADKPKRDQLVASHISTTMNAVYAMAYSLHSLVLEQCPEAFASDRDILRACINGPILLKYLRNISFMGVAGEAIRFDANGDMMGRFGIKQYRSVDGKPTWKTMAFWDREAGTFDVYEDRIDWNLFKESQQRRTTKVPESVCSHPCREKQYWIQRELSCCWDCYTCRDNEVVNGNETGCEECERFTWPDDQTQTICEPIDPSYPQLTDTSTLAILVLALLGVIGTISIAIWYFVHWNKRLIKASSRELSCILLCGCLSAFLVAFAFFTRPTRVTCGLARYGFFASVTLIYAPLVVKTNRVFRIFSAGKRGIKKPTAITNQAQLVFTFIILALQGCMSVLAGVLAPAENSLRMPILQERFVELFCVLPLEALVPPLSFNILLVCVCAVYGFLTRKLPENFNESWYIFVSVATTLFLWLVFLPTYFTAFYASHQVVLLASCLLINATVTLGCLFVPKIYAIHFIDESEIKVETVTGVTSNSTLSTEQSMASSVTSVT